MQANTEKINKKSEDASLDSQKPIEANYQKK